MAGPNGLSGGERLQAELSRISSALGKPGQPYRLRVGFLEGATYPDGTSVPYVAAINEFGARIEREPSTATIYRLVGKSGGFLRKGKFVRRSKSNFATTHYVGAYTISIPPRPFFRNMIAKHAAHWPADIAAALRSTGMDGAAALSLVGFQIRGELQQSITDTNTPPNAPSTVRRKGFNKPLIDTGYMRNKVDYAVDAPSSTGDTAP